MIPAPFSWLAAGAVWALRGAWWLFTTITGNVAHFGAPWVLAYWLAVVGLWNLGTWGAVAIRQVRRGNDFIEFAPQRDGGRPPWYGRPAALVIRTQVAGEAWVATMATVIGYGGALVLLVVGLVWTWLAVAVAMVALSKAFEARRRARR
jgi:hypothetical protein